MSDSNNYTFTWPAGPNEVILTGTFDDWKGSLPLVKTSSGSFEIVTPLPEPKEEDNGKIYFKFIVDGDWTISDNYEKESGGSGFDNNFINVQEIRAENESNNVTNIPEAGGLPATVVTPTVTEEDKDKTIHILPIDEPKTEGTNVIGGPGPVIPEDATNIKEFSEVRDVDAKELNERLNKELKEKKESKQESEEIIKDKESQTENEDQTIEAEIPIIQTEEEETKPYERAAEPSPESKTEETEKKEVKVAKPVKKTTKPAAKPATKTKEEPKKPKKGIFGKLKKMFA